MFIKQQTKIEFFVLYSHLSGVKQTGESNKSKASALRSRLLGLRNYSFSFVVVVIR
jgi:hypothetical protein